MGVKPDAEEEQKRIEDEYCKVCRIAGKAVDCGSCGKNIKAP